MGRRPGTIFDKFVDTCEGRDEATEIASDEAFRGLVVAFVPAMAFLKKRMSSLSPDTQSFNSTVAVSCFSRSRETSTVCLASSAHISFAILSTVSDRMSLPSIIRKVRQVQACKPFTSIKGSLKPRGRL